LRHHTLWEKSSEEAVTVAYMKRINFIRIHKISGLKVAIKLASDYSLVHESHAYRIISDFKIKKQGFPKIEAFLQQEGYTALVMEMLGPSIEGLFCSQNNLMRTPMIKSIALQIVYAYIDH